MEISGILDHLEIGQSQKDLWMVRIGEAICNFKHAVELDKNRVPSKTQYLWRHCLLLAFKIPRV